MLHFHYKTEITCGRSPTSCADQLAKAVRAAYEEERSPESA